MIKLLTGGDEQQEGRSDEYVINAGLLDPFLDLKPTQEQAIVAGRNGHQQAGSRHEVNALIDRQIALKPVAELGRDGHLIKTHKWCTAAYHRRPSEPRQ